MVLWLPDQSQKQGLSKRFCPSCKSSTPELAPSLRFLHAFVQSGLKLSEPPCFQVMFPRSEYREAHSTQRLPVCCVSLPVACKLWNPVSRVRFWSVAVCRTAVVEAAIREYR